MKNNNKNKACLNAKKIAFVCAVLGAALSLASTQPNFVKFWVKYLSFPDTRKGINDITHDTNRYRTKSYERHIQILPAQIKEPKTGKIIPQPRCFYITKSEHGFKFIESILVANYYENIGYDIVAFIQYQKYHTKYNPQNPDTTFRPIYAIRQNNETENLYKNIDPAKKEESSEIMKKMLIYKEYISSEKSLTSALDSYFKSLILFWATISIIASILLSRNYINAKHKPKGENKMPNSSEKKTTYIKFFVNVDLNTIKKLTEIVQAKLKEGVERFGLLISSPGGGVFAGLSGYNFLKGIPAEVITHNFGSADSIATILYCAGSKRYCVPNARFLLHGIGANINMRINEKILDENLKGLKADRENISKVISDNTKKSLEEVEKDILDGKVLTSQQAIDYGLAHEIKTELFERGAEIIEIVQ